MKKGEPIKVVWSDVLKKFPNVEDVKGYSTVEQIAERTNSSTEIVYRTLKKLRLEGKVDFIEARRKTGKITFVYKD